MKAKVIIKETIAMIILIAAIALITILVFFDYIKAEADQPQAAIYQMTPEEENLIAEKQKYTEEKDKLILSSDYSIDEEDLKLFKESGTLTQGQSSPFDEMPITDILYDQAGNAYYNTTNVRKPHKTNTTNETNNNTTNNQTENTINNDKNQVTNTTNQPTTTTNNSTATYSYSAHNSYSSDISTSSPSSGTIIESYSGAGK